VFKLDDNWRPLEYIENDYEDKGDIVLDHATGLMWEKSGSSDMFFSSETQEYIQALNKNGFAGYKDWRLPTMVELISLLEPEKQTNDLFIDTIFDEKQRWCWSSDNRSSGRAFGVYFDSGIAYWLFVSSFVRAVRSFPDNDG